MTAKRYDDPPVQLLQLLGVCKLEGRPFEEAWTEARAALRYPHETATRQAFREALDETKDEWQAAYEDHETPTSRQLTNLLERCATA